MLLAKNDYVEIKVPATIERALIVAEQADKNLLIIGNDRIFINAVKTNICFFLPCPCGNFGLNSQRKCKCQVQQIEKHQREYLNYGDMRIDGYIGFRSFKFSNLDDMCIALLKQAYAENFINAAELITTLDIAKAIMELDETDTIKVEHIAEALSYRKRIS